MLRQVLTKLNNMLFYLLLAVVVGLAGWLSNRHFQVWDLSAGGDNTLSQTSQTLLSRLEEPLHITSFAPVDAELRGRIQEVIDLYRRYRPDISFDFINPDLQPALTRQLGIRALGELRLEYQGRTENLININEESISNAIQHLMQGGERWIGVVVGHGERSMQGRANHDLGTFGNELALKGYKIRNLKLSTLVEIPHNLSLMIIASPRVNYLEQEVDKIINYIESGGNLLWLFDPGDDPGLDRLRQKLGLKILPGVIVDANAASYRLNDPAMAVVETYPEHQTTTGFELVTLFPYSAAIMAIGDVGWESTPLLRTMPDSWNETGPIKGEVERNQGQGEIAGPLNIGIAFTNRQRDGQIVMAIGDGDFLSNSYLGNGGNLDLGLNLIRWMSNDLRVLDIPARTAPDLRLELSDTARTIIGFGFLLILPLLLLSTGAIIWWRRRRL